MKTMVCCNVNECHYYQYPIYQPVMVLVIETGQFISVATEQEKNFKLMTDHLISSNKF